VVPIYEFYCPDCHALFSFFSATVDTDARPACPECGRPELGRRPSTFATLRGDRSEGGSEGDADDPFSGIDDERMERAFEAMAGEFGALEGAEEPDPRELSRALRRFTDLTGLEAGPKLRDVLDRLERGEDPESLEAEMSDGAEGDEDLGELFRLRRSLFSGRTKRPRVDQTLHFL